MNMKKLQKPIVFPVKVYYCLRCGEQLRTSIAEEWFDIRSGVRYVNFVWKCPKFRFYNILLDLIGQGHTKIKTTEDGTILEEYSGM